MRILLVSAPFPLSRNEVAYSFIFDEAVRLSNRDVELHVASYLMRIHDKRMELSVNGVRVHKFSEKIDASILLSSMKGLTELPLISLVYPKIVVSTVTYSCFIAKLVEKYDIDIIHAHFAYPEGFAAMLAKNVVQKPLVLTLHGYDIVTDPSVNYGKRLKKRYDTMIRKVLAKADIVFGASKYVCAEALNAGCSQERLVHLPNGVDLKRFTPDIDGSPLRSRFVVNDRPVIFTLRGHSPKNGIEYLIKAVPSVLRDVPNAMFIIGGEGPLRSYHEHLAEELGVSRHVLFVGRIPPMELPRYYAACNIFVIPSVIEAFGLVTVEAMACGKPVIGSNVGGIPEVIKEGVNGLLVKPRDPEDLANKIVSLLENPDLTKKMGAEGRRMAEENFDIKRRIDRILTIYSKLKR